MDLGKIGMFQLMRQNMDYLAARQDVISENIANSGVVDYKVRDIKRPDFESILEGNNHSQMAGVATTNPKHIAGIGNANNVEFEVEKPNTFEISPTGNNVVLEEESMKLSKTSMEYQQTTGIYRKMVQLIKMALGEQV